MASERAISWAKVLEHKWQDMDEASVAELIDKFLQEERREACKPLVDAIMALKPVERKEDCWCPYGHDTKQYRHFDRCIQVRAALEKAKGEKETC